MMANMAEGEWERPWHFEAGSWRKLEEERELPAGVEGC